MNNLNRSQNMLNMPVSHPWQCIVLCLLIFIVTAFGLRLVVINADYEVYFDGHSPRLNAHYEIEALYGRHDSLRIMVQHENNAVLSVAFLAGLEELTERVWKLPYVTRVQSLTNYSRIVGNGDTIEVEDLFERVAQLSASELREKITYALSEPELLNHIISPKGDNTLIATTIVLPENDKTAGAEVIVALDKLLTEFTEEKPGYRFYTSGSIPVSHAFFKESTIGMAKLIVFMLSLSVLMMGIFFRSVKASMIVLVVILMSAISGIGLAGWLGIPFAPQSSTAPVIIMALALAMCIHLISAYKYNILAFPNDKTNFTQALSSNFVPISLATFTTIIGLLCLNFSTVPPLVYLGNTTALGVLMAMVYAFFLLPAVYTVADNNDGKANDPSDARDFMANVDWSSYVKILRQYQLSIGLLMLVFIAFLFVQIPKNIFDDSLITYFDSDQKVRMDTEMIESQVAPFSYSYVSISAEGFSGVADPQFLMKLESLVTWIRKQEEIKHVVSFTDNMKNINRAMHGNQAEYYKISENGKLASQTLLLYEMSLPYGSDLSNIISMDHRSTFVRIGFKSGQGSLIRNFDKKLKAWMSDNFTETMRAIPAGPSLLFAYIWHDTAKQNIQSMLIAFLLISVVITLALKSIKLGFISLIPNIFPAAMAYGVWGLTVGKIDIGSSLVAVISFGIIVDDTIHFLSKYESARKRGDDAETAIAYTLNQVGRALIITTSVLALGFLVFVASSLNSNSAMGIITSLAISFALLLDLVFLPILLLVFDKNGRSNNQDVKQKAP